MIFYNKRLLAAGLCTILLASQVLPVYADTQDEIDAMLQEQAETNAELEGVQSSLSKLEEKKAAVLDRIDGYDTELVITIAAINQLDGQIEDMKAKLEQTAKDLEEAEADQAEQYEAMKKRIQYLYEEGGDAGWANVVLGDGKLSEALDRADYTQSLYDYDRDELEAYMDSISQVEALQEQQLEQKGRMETMLHEQTEARENLEQLKKKAEAESEDYEERIADAEAVASEYYALIQEQNAKIAELQERKAAEEEAARKAAEEEARRMAALEAQRQALINGSQHQPGSGYTEPDTSGMDDEQAAQQQETQDLIDDGYLDVVDTEGDPGANADDYYYYDANGVSGVDVANYALQFVGNPYVWGGTSLTNGCDCSGFVQQVYAHFGINLSRTTYTQANEGIAVSYDEMIPGDVINYGFHTAIYIGGNMIVHAADSRLGIITQENPAYQAIVTIRRFIY